MSGNFRARAGVVDSIRFKQLLLPGKEPKFMNYVLKGGHQYLVGSVLGRITASGLLVVASASAGDGSQTPMAVLGETVDAFNPDGSPHDTPMSVIVSAYVNDEVLIFGPGLSINNTRERLRDIGIYTRVPGFSG